MREPLAFTDAARCLAELGHPHRLQIFNLLVKAGETGMPVGAIRDDLDIPKSSLAHHLAELVAVGLLTQTREGRVQRCRVDPERVHMLMLFMSECCEGLPGLAAAV